MRQRVYGFTLVEIMIVVAIIGLLATIGIPRLLRARIATNDSITQSTLRTLSTAAETFGNSNNGNYPTLMTSLTGATPPYVVMTDPCNTIFAGFSYSCSLGLGGYTFIATPTAINVTGSTTFTITTGGVLR